MHDRSYGRAPNPGGFPHAGAGFGGDARGVPAAPPVPPVPRGRPPVPPGPEGFFGRGPGGPRVKKGDVRAASLALLAEGPRNGYQIIQQIAVRSHGIWRPSPGSVYPALQQLEDEGLVDADEEGGRRVYHLTAEGRAHVDRHGSGEPWDEVAESVPEEMVDLHSLLGQVGMAMRQVAVAGTRAQVRDARKILINTRRALYRLLADDAQEAS